MTKLQMTKELIGRENAWVNYRHEILKDDEVVGVAYTMLDTEDDSEVYLEDIEIDKEYRGQGIGTWAINTLAEEYGFIYFAPTNENNKRLYERIAEEYTVNTPEVDQGFGVYFIEK
jgi:ribosomal protein S18 acetylase RimI-like enzyme